jgi:uncharacterized HAD superfamily protein
VRIGIDLDNTLCDTLSATLPLQKKYSIEKNIPEEMIWSIEEVKKDFLKNNLREIYINSKLKRGVKSSLNRLKEEGVSIFVITARNREYAEDIERITHKLVKGNQLPIEKVFFNSRNKIGICLKNRVELMIEDRYDKFTLLKNAGVNVLLFDDKGQYSEESDRILGWNRQSVEKILRSILRS